MSQTETRFDSFFFVNILYILYKKKGIFEKIKNFSCIFKIKLYICNIYFKFKLHNYEKVFYFISRAGRSLFDGCPPPHTQH